MKKMCLNARRIIVILIMTLLSAYASGCGSKMETQVDRRWQYEKIATLKKLSGISTFQLDGKNRAHVIYTAGPDFYYAMQTNKGWKVEKVVNPDLKNCPLQ